MKIANNTEVLELDMNMMERHSLIHPTLIWDEYEVILADTGMIGQFEGIRKSMDKMGVPFSKLSKVILTGSLPEI